MPINASLGNMYIDIDGTVNFIKGACDADCLYCFMKYGFRKNLKVYQEPYKLVQKEFDTFDAEPRSRIFCGSATDMWKAPAEYIREVLEFCILQEIENEIDWLFQTKFPVEVSRWIQYLPRNCMIGVTLETNRVYERRISKAPSPPTRAYSMKQLMDLWIKFTVHKRLPDSYLPRIMVSVEPAMPFDLEPFVEMIRTLEPEYVSIGVDTQAAFIQHGIEKPTIAKLFRLSEALGAFTQVKVKPNVLSLADEMVDRGFIAKTFDSQSNVTMLQRRRKNE